MENQYAIWWQKEAKNELWGPGERRAPAKEEGASGGRRCSQAKAAAWHQVHKCSAPASPYPQRGQAPNGL